MDTILNTLAGVFGIDPATLLLFFGVLVAVCNLVGRLIPDDAVGYLGLVRRVCKIVGLYISNRVTSGVSVNDTARAVAGASAITAKSDGSPPITIKLRSPAIVAVLAGIAAFFLSGCTPLQIATTADALCQSVPLAQAALDSATASKNVALAQRILDRVNRLCPGVLTSLDLAQAVILGAKTRTH